MRTRTTLPPRSLVLILSILILAAPCVLVGAESTRFRRGDANSDARVDLSDAVSTLNALFLGRGEIGCRDASDANDDGSLDLTDAVSTLLYLFLHGSPPPAPGLECGRDLSDDELGCEAYAACGREPAYDGPSEFASPLDHVPGGAPGRDAEDGLGGAPLPNAGEPSESTPREIEESDIYRLEGDLMYVLNRYRGLQVLDISDLTAPELLGRVPMFGHPMEMFVRDGRAYVILTDYYRFYQATSRPSGVDGFYGSQVVVVDLSAGSRPQVVDTIDLAGFYSDSRLVGNILYLVSSVYYWHYGAGARNSTEIVSLDLSDPQGVRLVERLSFPRDGWDHHIHATPDAIYLAEAGYDHSSGAYRTLVRYVNIEDPAGDIELRGQVVVPGLVQDRWSLDVSNNVLRVASGGGWWGSVFLNTYSVADPDRISRLGGYTLNVNETLTATRFDGSRGYLVTYRNIDPLFAFDLSDPVRPALLGELEMSGWLDFMVPRGDRLIALGHEDLTDPSGGRRFSLAVSLIDVAAGAPRLLDRVVLDGDWGFVPGDRDDFAKVFRVVDSAGLILFPYQTWDFRSYRLTSAVQLIDFDRDSLARRGRVEDIGWAERAIPHGEDGILTLSSQVFQSIDIADRDQPEVLGRLELARNVQSFAVHPGGEHSVQLTGDWSLGDLRLTVTPLSDPDAARPTASVRVPAPSGRLFTDGALAYVAGVDDVWEEDGTVRERNTRVQVFDLSDPEHPLERGSVTLPVAVVPFYDDWFWGWGDEAVQVQGSTLVFHSTPQGTWWRGVEDCWGCGGLDEETDDTLYIVDMSDPDAPRLTSTIPLGDLDWAWGLKAVGTTVYLSTYRAFQNAEGRWMARYFVYRFDVTDPERPVVLAPINIPGTFLDASQDGEIIYSYEYRCNSPTGSYSFVIHALAVRDRRAYLQSSVTLPGYPNGITVDGSSAVAVSRWWRQVPLGDGNYRWESGAELVTVDLTDFANLEVSGRVEVPEEYAYLREVDSGLAFVGCGPGILVYDVSDVTRPSLATFFRTQNYPQEFVVHEGSAYVPTGYYGVQVLNLSGLGR
jgi:hypothetical protein